MEQYQIDFLLKDFEQLWIQARHVDEHMERIPRFFLIVVAAAATAVAAIVKLSDLTHIVCIGIGISLIALAVIGFFASLTIPRTRVIRLYYLNSIFLFRRHFVGHEEELKNHKYYQMDAFEGAKGKLRIDFFRYMMMVTMVALLLGAGIFIICNSHNLINLPNSIPDVHWILIPIILPIWIVVHIKCYSWIISFYERKDREPASDGAAAD